MPSTANNVHIDSGDAKELDARAPIYVWTITIFKLNSQMIDFIFKSEQYCPNPNPPNSLLYVYSLFLYLLLLLEKLHIYTYTYTYTYTDYDRCCLRCSVNLRTENKKRIGE